MEYPHKLLSVFLPFSWSKYTVFLFISVETKAVEVAGKLIVANEMEIKEKGSISGLT